MNNSAIERRRRRLAFDRDLSREFLLVVACCDWPLSSRRLEAIHRAVQKPIDWDEFLRLTARHRVAGLVHHAVSFSEIDVPPAIAEALATEARQIARQNLAHAAEMRRLQCIFGNAGISVVFVKGISLGLLAYGSLGLKHGKDIDILVPVASAEAAVGLLEREGYGLCHPYCDLDNDKRHLIFRYCRDLAMLNSRSGVQVELHWRLTDNPELLKNVDALSSRQHVALTNNFGFPTLNEADLFSYLCAHGALHGWSRLKWIADLCALISSANDDVPSLYRHAKDRGAARCAGQALLLCECLFDRKLPAALGNELRANKKLDKLVRIALAGMRSRVAEAEGGVSSGMRAYLRRFSLGEGWAFYAAQSKARSVSLADVAQFPLPSPLHFLYPFLRPPLWLWRRARS